MERHVKAKWKRRGALPKHRQRLHWPDR